MAIVVTVGGLMGYLKRGSKISLVAGGGSAALFYYVYRELPGNPVLASSVGIGNGIKDSLSVWPLHFFRYAINKWIFILGKS